MPALLSSLLVILALPPLGWSVSGLLCCVPLLWSAAHHTPARAAVEGLAFGLIVSSYAYLGAWTYDTTVYAIIIAMLALLSALFLWGAARLIRNCQQTALILVPLLWVLVELVLESVRIPFTLALVLTGRPTFLQLADLGGQHLISYLLITFQLAVALGAGALLDRRLGGGKSALRYGFLATLPALVGLGYAAYVRGHDFLPSAAPVNVAVIQTDIHPIERATVQADGKLEALARIRATLIQRLGSLKAKPDLVLWPEVSFARFEFRTGSNIARVAHRHGLAMLVASPDLQPDGTIINAVFAISKQGRVVHRHAKSILLPMLEDEFTGAADPVTHFTLPGSPGSLICFESAFSSVAHRLTLEGAGLLTISTSDAYAGPSILPLLHREYAKLRAVETRRYVLRAANGGASAVISPFGEQLDGLGLFSSGIITALVAPLSYRSIYTRYGDFIHVLWWILCLPTVYLVLRSARRRARTNSSSRPRILVRRLGTAVAAAILLCAMQSLYISRLYDTEHPASGADRVLPRFRVVVDESSLSYKSVTVNKRADSVYAALAYLLRDYGMPENYADVMARAQSIIATGHRGDLLHALAQGFGLVAEVRDFRGSKGLPDHLYAPSLVELSSGEVVVLLDVEPDYVVLFSPVRGKEVAITKQAFLKAWRREAVRLLPHRRDWDTVSYPLHTARLNH